MTFERRVGMLTMATAVLGAGCAARGVSPQLSAARMIMGSARNGSAQQFEPEQVLVAQRNLELAEAQTDGSTLEAHYAYLSERETRTAIANSHRAIIEGVRPEGRPISVPMALPETAPVAQRLSP